MSQADHLQNSDEIIADFAQKQIEHFQVADPRCRALQLPEGIMLRYTLVETLYFYLHSGVREGKIFTRIFASDSPYDRQKTCIGDVTTPMFELNADFRHFQRLQELLHSWVDFVRQDPNAESAFRSFEVRDRPD